MRPATAPLHASDGHSPRIAHAFVAPTALVVGDVAVGDDAGIFFGCAVVAGGARIVIGPRTNVQDNSILVTDRARGDIVIGAGGDDRAQRADGRGRRSATTR